MKILMLMMSILLVHPLQHVTTFENRPVSAEIAQTYTNENFSYHIHHVYHPAKPLEYWVTTITPKDRKARMHMMKKAFGHDVFSSRERLSTFAERKNAVIAINASGFHPDGRVKGLQIRNGRVYQGYEDGLRFYETAVIYRDGTLDIVEGRNTDPQQLVKKGVVHSFHFGPWLVKDSIPRPKGEKISLLTKKNPRQAIGQKPDGTVVIITVDGRSSRSEGMDIYDLARLFISLGCKVAYNLDGGGSAQTVIDGKALNHYSDGKERPVPDFLYFTS